MRVLLIVAFSLGCTTTVAPTSAPPTNSLEIGNGTTIAVTLVVNGNVLGVFPPGAAGVIPISELPPLPWTVEARSPRGRVLTSMTVRPGDVRETTMPNGGRAYQSAGARADLSCGRLDIWSGMPMLGPLPGPGKPGDCEP